MRQISDGNFRVDNSIARDNIIISHQLKKRNQQRAFIGYAEMACRVVVLGYVQAHRNITPYKHDVYNKNCKSEITLNTTNQ